MWPEHLRIDADQGIRNRENPPYTDKEVALLPDITVDHPHYREWLSRKRSSHRLIQYLVGKRKPVAILEVGCGNGWLSSELSTVPGSKVIGIDKDLAALQQAARVFHGQPNLKFIYGDFYSDVLQELSFDIIVFAASIQNFPSLARTLETALLHLKQMGEIHILDSPICKTEEWKLHTFHCRRLYNPRSVWNRLFRKEDRLPWICINCPSMRG